MIKDRRRLVRVAAFLVTALSGGNGGRGNRSAPGWVAIMASGMIQLPGQNGAVDRRSGPQPLAAPRHLSSVSGTHRSGDGHMVGQGGAASSREQVLKQLFETAVGIADQNRSAWAVSALELADMVREGRSTSELLVVKDRLLFDEGLAQCERGFRDHRFDGTEVISEGLRRAIATVIRCVWDLRPKYEFDWVSIEQALRRAAEILRIPEEYLETYSEAAERTGETRDTIVELTRKRRSRPHPLIQVDKGGVMGAARVDRRKVDQLLQERRKAH